MASQGANWPILRAFIHRFEIEKDHTLVILKQTCQVMHEDPWDDWEVNSWRDSSRVAVFPDGNGAQSGKRDVGHLPPSS